MANSMKFVRVAAACTGGVLAAATATHAASRVGDEVLIFEDTFDTFNLSVWKHELTLSGGGNWEFEGYTNNRSVSRVSNGTLTISPTMLADMIGAANVVNGFDMNIWGGDPASACTGNQFYGCERASGGGGNVINPVQSARIRTAETFAFTYGRVEVTAKLPRGDWMWPAIWMLPVSAQYGNWPVSGEIDIMESRGNAAGYAAGGCNMFSSTLHWGPFFGADAYTLTHGTYTIPTGDLSEAFHVYGLLWNETNMITYIDSQTNVVLNVPLNGTSFWQMGGWKGVNNPWQLGGGGPNAPFDQRFYLIINLAVGGTNGYFPDGVGNKPWTDTDPHAMDAFNTALPGIYSQWQAGSPFQIDSVRVWQAPGGDYAFRPML